jgi:hypothetical protein
MPLLRGKSKKVIKKNFDELGAGNTYAKTLKKKGRQAANKQRIAIVLSTARKNKKKG